MAKETPHVNKIEYIEEESDVIVTPVPNDEVVEYREQGKRKLIGKLQGKEFMYRMKKYNLSPLKSFISTLIIYAPFKMKFRNSLENK